MRGFVATTRLLSRAPAASIGCRQSWPAARPFHTSTFQKQAAPVRPSHLLPEFSLQDKVIAVSGGARGLGLVQIEALLEAGATGMALHTILAGVPVFGCDT